MSRPSSRSHYSRRSRISHRRGLLDRERSLSDVAADAEEAWRGPSRRRAVAEARLGEGSAGTGGVAPDRDVRRARRGLWLAHAGAERERDAPPRVEMGRRPW